MVFTTCEKSNQTGPLTQFEADSTSSFSSWWPCLIAEDATPNFKIVRCWEQNQRHSAPWWTPSARVFAFEDDDNEAEDEWTVIDGVDFAHHTTVHIEELDTP